MYLHIGFVQNSLIVKNNGKISLAVVIRLMFLFLLFTDMNQIGVLPHKYTVYMVALFS